MPELATDKPKEAVKPLDGHTADNLAEPPLELYEQKHGRPLVVDLLDMAPLYGRSGFEDAISEINQYILDQVNSRGLKSTKASYQAELERLRSELGLDSNLEYDRTLDTLKTYVKILRQQAELKKKMDQISGQ